jgi:hypothetical protein
MCVKPSDTLVATVQGWDDEDSIGSTYYGKFNKYEFRYDADGSFVPLADGDQTLRGVTVHTISSASGTLSSNNIQVTYAISTQGACDPNQADYDTDQVVDSKDNCPTHPNPDQVDMVVIIPF